MSTLCRILGAAPLLLPLVIALAVAVQPGGPAGAAGRIPAPAAEHGGGR
jgi:hypothetical protein